MTRLLVNPSRTFFASKSAFLDRDRAELFHRIRALSPELATLAETILEERTSPVSRRPLGELWPRLLTDLVGIPDETCEPIARAWMAIYLYTVIIDRQCDEPWRPLDPKEVLLASLVFEIGIGDLYAGAASKGAEAQVRPWMRDAIKGQLNDVQFRSPHVDLGKKRASAVAKNSGFTMCAAALAVAADADPSVLVNFSRSVVLAFQYLDDIADYEEDFRAGHFTPLLARAYSESGHELDAFLGSPPSRQELLRILIESSALRDILAETRTTLRTALSDLRLVAPSAGISASRSFFHDLDVALGQALRAVEVARCRLHPSPSAGGGAVLDDVARHLIVVAQQS